MYIHLSLLGNGSEYTSNNRRIVGRVVSYVARVRRLVIPGISPLFRAIFVSVRFLCSQEAAACKLESAVFGVKVTIQWHHEDVWRSGTHAPSFLNLSKDEGERSLHAPALLPSLKRASEAWSVRTESGCGGDVKHPRPRLESNCGHPARRQSLTTPVIPAHAVGNAMAKTLFQSQQAAGVPELGHDHFLTNSS
jgi:hypothetical protein